MQKYVRNLHIISLSYALFSLLLKMGHTSYLSFLHQPATQVAFFLAELRAYFHHAASISSPNYIVTIQVHFSVLQYQSNPQH